jgi:hypothetical protein
LLLNKQCYQTSRIVATSNRFRDVANSFSSMAHSIIVSGGNIRQHVAAHKWLLDAPNAPARERLSPHEFASALFRRLLGIARRKPEYGYRGCAWRA